MKNSKRMKPLLATLVVIASVTGGSLYAQNYVLLNGKWFDGQSFEKRVMYVVHGEFSTSKPAHVDSTIDLGGQFVIPPFGEAHTHNLESEWMLEERVKGYLMDGVFYAKMQSSIKKRVQTVLPILAREPGVDISYAHAPLTASGGHPVRLRESFFDRGFFDGLFETKAEIAGHGYFIIDTEEDLKNKWDKVLAASPDFIKCNLLYSEEYALRKDDPTYFGEKGLNPKLLRKVVEKAHDSGLRVSAHVNSVTDFHHAVAAGVNEINHMPSRHEIETIADEDARLAAEKGIVVVSTASLIKRTQEQNAERYEEIKRNMAANFRILKKHGVKLAVGSDIWDDNGLKEVLFLKEFGVFTNLELLKMWAVNAPQTIFPNRKIGVLQDGFEASFIVLQGNPVQDFENVKRITLRMKQGKFITFGS